jgi:Putative metallopeptidase
MTALSDARLYSDTTFSISGVAPMKSTKRGSSPMPSMIRGAALSLALLYPVFDVTPARAQAPAGIQNPQIEIAYRKPGNPAFQPIYDRLTKLKVLEQFKQFTAPLRLPRKLTVAVDQCNAKTRPYKPQGPVTVCYELVEQIERVAAKADKDVQERLIVGTFVQVVLHETSHAVFDILQVPVWGREEDAADNLAAFIMLQFGDDLALQTIQGTASFFQLSEKTWTGSDFADVNSPDPQRYFNYLCMAYGSDKTTFEFLAKADEGKEPVLPKRRAARCAREYEVFRKFFNMRIMPYVDPDLLTTVRSMQWVIK